MKVTITDDEVKFLANLIVLSEQVPNFSLEELGNNWANWVASPIAHHAIDPKEARALLTAVGILTDYKVPVGKIIEKILECFVENYSEAPGGSSHE